jgi:hypothetical protein
MLFRSVNFSSPGAARRDTQHKPVSPKEDNEVIRKRVEQDFTRSNRRALPVSLMACAVALGLAVWGNGHAQSDAQSGDRKPDPAMVKRGEYLVTIAGCNDCHTPWKMTDQGPAPDMSRMLSGHPHDMKVSTPPKIESPDWMGVASSTFTAWAGPWGISYSINLTPHETTGLAAWTEDMFINAMRTGKHMATSRPIMPPMPWQNLSKATEGDLKAIFAYLRTIPPIDNLVPDYQPPTVEGEGHSGH